MEPLLLPSELKAKFKNISAHSDDDRIKIAISEAESIDVKDGIGEQVYIDLVENYGGTNISPEQTILLDGGIYEIDGKKAAFEGLKNTIAYFALSRLISTANNNVSRFGFVNKDSDTSNQPEWRIQLKASDDARSTGNRYLDDCIRYVVGKGLDKVYRVKDKKKRKFTINALGD